MNMETNQSNLQHLPNPSLSASEHTAAIYTKIRIIGRIGFISNLLFAVSFFFAPFLYFAVFIFLKALMYARPEMSQGITSGLQHLQQDIPTMNLVFPFMWGIYGVFWCLVFRRFNPEKLITEKTANLVIITLVITLVLGCFNFQWAPAEDQKL
jgi:hypothetical protein